MELVSKITPEVLDLHAKWLRGEDGGKRLVSATGKIEIRADLSEANLSGANLSGAQNAEHVEAITSILPAGTLTVFKKAGTNNGAVLLTLEIPAEAKRSNATGRKCRAEYAILRGVEGIGWEYDGSPVHSTYDHHFIYPAVGERITPDKWDDNRWDECSNGIHFWITRYEAEHYN